MEDKKRNFGIAVLIVLIAAAVSIFFVTRVNEPEKESDNSEVEQTIENFIIANYTIGSEEVFTKEYFDPITSFDYQVKSRLESCRKAYSYLERSEDCTEDNFINSVIAENMVNYYSIQYPEDIVIKSIVKEGDVYHSRVDFRIKVEKAEKSSRGSDWDGSYILSEAYVDVLDLPIDIILTDTGNFLIANPNDEFLQKSGSYSSLWKAGNHLRDMPDFYPKGKE